MLWNAFIETNCVKRVNEAEDNFPENVSFQINDTPSYLDDRSVFKTSHFNRYKIKEQEGEFDTEH